VTTVPLELGLLFINAATEKFGVQQCDHDHLCCTWKRAWQIPLFMISAVTKSFSHEWDYKKILSFVNVVRTNFFVQRARWRERLFTNLARTEIVL
jgi:hypothetical protein